MLCTHHVYLSLRLALGLLQGVLGFIIQAIRKAFVN